MSYYPNLQELYLVIRKIKPSDHQGFVRYFEKNLEALSQLDSLEYLPLLIRYTESLHKIKQYYELNKTCDELIFLSIDENVQYLDGQDIYLRALYLKADALFNLRHFDESNKIYDALVNLAPDDKSVLASYKDSLLRQRKRWVNYILLTGIAFYFISPFAFIFQFFYIDRFYPGLSATFNLYRGAIIVAAFLLVLLGFGMQFLHAYYLVFVKSRRARI